MYATPSEPGTRPTTIEVRGPIRGRAHEILSARALELIAVLTRAFRPRIDELLALRRAEQASYDAGRLPAFLPGAAALRAKPWAVAPIAPDLVDRRVEITGPVDRKLVINALNSGANVFMADFEDATSPTWERILDGQINLFDAVRRTIAYRDEARGRDYRLCEDVATLMVRPRGLHLPEKHLIVDGRPAPAALVDFALYLLHNGAELLRRGSGPYFYLPKLQSHLEARLWDDVFVEAQRRVGIPRGSIRATVLIETLPAAFEMDEILWELREHSAGLNCGRWDYIFSYIKTLRADPSRVLPDRAQVGMTQPNMRAYTQLLVKTCHRRGAHAIGGMAAQIPIKADDDRNRQALHQVRTDKLREVADGHDGTWVAHPGLVAIAREVFDEHMPGPNQIDNFRDDVGVTADELLRTPTGTRTMDGLRLNVRVGLQYLEAWLDGRGCVPLYDLMEDAATAEISRSQLWQWVHHGVELADGVRVTRELVRRVIDEELDRIRDEIGHERVANGKFGSARLLFAELATSAKLQEFFTTTAYERLVVADWRTQS